MPRKFRIAYFTHSLRSDWNNGNAHFLRGLLRSMGQLGHQVTIYEPADEWSIRSLREEPTGAHSLQQFGKVYPDLNIIPYRVADLDNAALWTKLLGDSEVVLLHEWNPPQLAHVLLGLRSEIGYRLLFHDTHHRASSSPDQIRLLGIHHFDGVLAFGEALRRIYVEQFRMEHVWTLHEAADISVFHPFPSLDKRRDIVWVGNWGDGERSAELHRFLLEPAARLQPACCEIFGVRYPPEGLDALQSAGVSYCGYLPNLDAPRVYAESRLTVHVPRQQYAGAMTGIPTIRVFEALACGIPLISAPWDDAECLFREDDFLWARTTDEMAAAMRLLLANPAAARAQSARGLETILSRHTCDHRARQLASICEEMLP